jgi:hypothetical protein
MWYDGPTYARYSASIEARRTCQNTRDALGGYVAIDHPDHADNSSSQRRQAIHDADSALQLATTEMDAAFAAHRDASDTRAGGSTDNRPKDGWPAAGSPGTLQRPTFTGSVFAVEPPANEAWAILLDNGYNSIQHDRTFPSEAAALAYQALREDLRDGRVIRVPKSDS